MKRVLVFAIAIGAFFSVPLMGKGKPHKHNKVSGVQLVEPAKNDKEPWFNFKMTIPEKGTLLRYGDEIIALPRTSNTQLPFGLAKKVARGRRLPPGWQRKISIGRQFPEFAYEHARQLPPYILYQLPKQPEGTALVVIEGKIVRLYEATKTIIDVFDLKW